MPEEGEIVMIKPGDKVAPFLNVTQSGVVLEVVHVKSSTWMAGGTMGQTPMAIVKLDKDGSHMKFKTEDLMILDR
jgi:hypothetical protein